MSFRELVAAECAHVADGRAPGEAGQIGWLDTQRRKNGSHLRLVLMTVSIACRICTAALDSDSRQN